MLFAELTARVAIVSLVGADGIVDAFVGATDIVARLADLGAATPGKQGRERERERNRAFEHGPRIAIPTLAINGEQQAASIAIDQLRQDAAEPQRLRPVARVSQKFTATFDRLTEPLLTNAQRVRFTSISEVAVKRVLKQIRISTGLRPEDALAVVVTVGALAGAQPTEPAKSAEGIALVGRFAVAQAKLADLPFLDTTPTDGDPPWEDAFRDLPWVDFMEEAPD